jgi:hypothetical protein
MICDVCELERVTTKEYEVCGGDCYEYETVRLCQFHYFIIRFFIDKTKYLTMWKKNGD